MAPERGRRRDEMVAISGSLTLLTNLVIAWNTQRMQATVDGGDAKDDGSTTSGCAGWGLRILRT
ncbi:hypothetical protein WJ60_30160 [Burkholderia ubonensis]|uniref:Tn3 family transposase n=1 Tax=Burkholderia ubonensis TaxID=101571 RepID=UPI00075357B5|nr:Tn3 family transposase [Burkholderia ubonensis]KVM77224.1 hypothetical protein WJ60_30160 [Burkholderia ubonensis]